MRGRIGLLLLISVAPALAGCLHDGTVRALLVEESFTLGPDAPERADEEFGFEGCVPGEYDRETGLLHLAPRDRTVPIFATLVQREEGRVIAMTGGAGGPWEPRGIGERGSSGAFSWSGPWRDAPDVVRVSYDRDGARVNDVPLAVGAVWTETFRYRATHEDASFDVEHRVKATYLGRVPYDETLACAEAPT